MSRTRYTTTKEQLLLVQALIEQEPVALETFRIFTPDRLVKGGCSAHDPHKHALGKYLVASFQYGRIGSYAPSKDRG